MDEREQDPAPMPPPPAANSVADRTANFIAGVRHRLKSYRLRRRRRNAAKRKTASRKVTVALSLVLLVLLGAFAGALKYLTPRSEGIELSIDELSALAAQHRITDAHFRDEDNRLVGDFVAEPIVPVETTATPPDDADEDEGNKKNKSKGRGDRNDQGNAPAPAVTAAPDAPSAADGELDLPAEVAAKAPDGSGTYWVTYPSSDAAFGVLSEMVTEAGARVTIDPQTNKAIVRATSTYLLPLLILATFFGLLFTSGRGAGSAIGEVLTFGTLGNKRQRKGLSAPVTFGDVAGADEAVAELREVVDYLSNPERYGEIGAVPPKGVLLFGPPGCGKTLLAKAVAGEAGVPFFSVAGAEFVESLVGVGAARVRDLFLRVRAVAPAIVFIDELDAAGRKRGHGEGGGSDEREQTLNQLLVEMDGFEVSSGIVVMGATNRPDILDPALLRPGRFDRHITVDQPDAEGRHRILELHARGKPMADTVDFTMLAKRTPGFSGADLANVINEAALLTIREGNPEIEMPELLEAIQRVLHGPKRRGRVLTPEERNRAAYHESGHAVVAAALGHPEEIHRVTILARGRGLGVTGLQRETDSVIVTRRELYAKLVIAMAGVACEELVLGEPSTGAEQDIEHATELARDIAGRYGMSPRIGRTRLLASDVDRYLGGDAGFSQLSPELHESFDTEVARLLAQAESDATKLLKRHRNVLDVIARRLEEEETIEGEDLVRALSLIRPEKAVSPAAEVFLGNGQRARDAARRPARRRAQPKGTEPGE